MTRSMQRYLLPAWASLVSAAAVDHNYGHTGYAGPKHAMAHPSAAASVAAGCYVTEYAAVAAAVSNCSSLVLDGITVPAGVTLDLNGLQEGAELTFAGRTFWEHSTSPPKTLLEIGGDKITVRMNKGAVLDGNGASWWDGLGSNGGVAKPDHFIQLKNINGPALVEDLYIENYPVHCFYINYVTDTIIRGITLNNLAGNAPNNISDGLPAAHNTDGFDVSACTNLLITDSVVHNQDDCAAVTSGLNVTLSNLYCEGSHGLSIGSIGGKSDNNVTAITFKDSTLVNCQNGARIKTNYNTTGYVHDILYENIVLHNISTYGIDIQQDYLNGGPTGTPSNGVLIDGVTMRNIVGTVASDADDVYILCGDGSCEGIVFDNIDIRGGASVCNYQPEGYDC